MNFTAFRRLVGFSSAAVVMLGSATVMAQPQQGFAIQQGFTPDPFVVEGTAGGTISGEQMQSGCRGNFSMAPSAIFVARSGFPVLRFAALSSEDTTILVRGPGRVECNDDGEGLNPVVEFANAPAGQYFVFVGAYSAGQTPRFRLGVSANSSFQPSTLGAAGPNPNPNPNPIPTPTPPGQVGPLTPDARPRLGRINVPGALTSAQVRRSRAVGTVAVSGQVRGQGTCRGFTTAPPTYVLSLRQAQSFVRAFVVSAADTTIVVRHPDGSIQCADDTYGFHPAIEGAFSAGEHQIWVGTYRAGANNLYQLTVTPNQGDQPPAPAQ